VHEQFYLLVICPPTAELVNHSEMIQFELWQTSKKYVFRQFLFLYGIQIIDSVGLGVTLTGCGWRQVVQLGIISPGLLTDLPNKSRIASIPEIGKLETLC